MLMSVSDFFDQCRFFIALVCVLVVSVTAEKDDIRNLRLVHLVYRHGDRTPIDPYPNDPYNNESLWPVHFGELTNRGKMMHFKLGKYLRQRYGHLLSDRYNPDEIYIRSSDKHRTLMSAESNLAGFYPPVGDDVWNPHLNWQPIPVHTVPEEEDRLLRNANCPRAERARKDVEYLTEIEAINRKLAPLYENLTFFAGEEIRDLKHLNWIYDTLFIEDLYNFTLPDWTKQFFPDKMKAMAEYSFLLDTYTTELKRLRGGPFVETLISNMKRKIIGNLTQNVMMYSGHDSSLAVILHTMGVFDLQFPPYASCVMIELLFQSENEYVVKILYRNDTRHEPYVLTVPGCETLCPLDKLTELMKPIIPQDWEKECGLKTESVTEFVGVIVGCVISVLLLINLIVVTIYWRKQQQRYFQYHHVIQEEA